LRNIAGRIAVVTGGGSGMGRELVRQLVAEGCNVAMCDVSAPSMAETRALCEAAPMPQGTRITTHIADVADEGELVGMREELARQHDTDKVHLLFNNAGIGGGGSMIANSRSQWERTFNVCWGGVYLCTRVFLPMLMRADAGHIVNTSSVNGFWASLGPNVAHTAYSAAKFAVKGFTEALINDLRVHAPHIRCSLVMPGHIGTSIVANSRTIHRASQGEEMARQEIAEARRRAAAGGIDEAKLSDHDIEAMFRERARRFLQEAPMTAEAAATVILEGVKADRWRILVGRDAERLDELVRSAPEDAYEEAFFARFAAAAGWRLGR
jgi:NAD(P)-dependent dehydrogenase (short-subunit alcohol dehydrogenase family)